MAINGTQPKLVMLVFILQIGINWLYVLWASVQAPYSVQAWFALLPMIGYFYFAFTILALVGMHYRQTLGLSLAYILILSGAIFDMLSNQLAEQNHLIDLTIVPLILLNFCVIGYLAFNQRYFRNN